MHKRVMSLRDPFPRHYARFEEILHRWRAVGNTECNLNGPRLEPQTYHSTDKRITARFHQT